MYTKYILKGLATGVLALATLASCNTNIEALEIIKPTFVLISNEPTMRCFLVGLADGIPSRLT